MVQAREGREWEGQHTADYLHSLHDFHEELPEDAEMVEQEIPGLVVPEEGTISSFQTVVTESHYGCDQRYQMQKLRSKISNAKTAKG